VDGKTNDWNRLGTAKERFLKEKMGWGERSGGEEREGEKGERKGRKERERGKGERRGKEGSKRGEEEREGREGRER
jgi:hypothetical protein